MEFSEKLQKLRTQRNLTQEQLANQLFVSRTAISKWETGRGTPNLDSLQAIAKLFGVSLDELLSTEEVVVMAKNENKRNTEQILCYIDSVLNLMSVFGFLLPMYKVFKNNVYYCVPLYQYSGFMHKTIFIIQSAILLCGVLGLIFQWKEKEKIYNFVKFSGYILMIIFIFLLIALNHPNASSFCFAFLLIKGMVLIKGRKIGK
ncbi:MAG TPA: helix-turn-helix transcriptional regulator [Ruminococcus sp.]|nr:helix-turn-helix transcriptional regulator [Ruminococcus sp.]MDY3214033.1 helix-turn-helix transcriptional regulator [Ruminococcus sp.]MDY3843803.1 helix-turn-helix transcriptional regulator [Ruminococcus sp.]HOF68596.1 helix-turn-helix transcriptional regulator [Ruminococcus sp.]